MIYPSDQGFIFSQDYYGTVLIISFFICFKHQAEAELRRVIRERGQLVCLQMARQPLCGNIFLANSREGGFELISRICNCMLGC